jgi:hypothetical protein
MIKKIRKEVKGWYWKNKELKDRNKIIKFTKKKKQKNERQLVSNLGGKTWKEIKLS